jgi:hypothetical protein
MRNWLMMRTTGAGRTGHRRGALALAIAGTLLSGSQAVAEDPLPPAEVELICPPVRIRAGASTYAVAVPGKQPVGSDLRYQATITRTARDCHQNGDQIIARIGIQGRVISGPAGSPATVEVPIRVAVVQGGIQERTITTKVYRTTVSMSEAGNDAFSLVAEDIAYPVPSAETIDSYIFYIGFDPQALAPAPRAARGKKN